MFHQDTLCVEINSETYYSLQDRFHMGIFEVDQRKFLKLTLANTESEAKPT